MWAPAYYMMMKSYFRFGPHLIRSNHYRHFTSVKCVPQLDKDLEGSSYQTVFDEFEDGLDLDAGLFGAIEDFDHEVTTDIPPHLPIICNNDDQDNMTMFNDHQIPNPSEFQNSTKSSASPTDHSNSKKQSHRSFLRVKGQVPSDLRLRKQMSTPLDFLDEPTVISPEFNGIKSSSPFSLISLIENAAATNVTSLFLWAPAAERLTQIAEDLKPQDTLRVLNAFKHAGMIDRALWGACSLPLLRHMSKLRPMELIQILELYECAGVRPEKLYVATMHALTKSADAMYGEEYANVMKVLAQLKLANGQLLAQLARAIAKNMNMLTFNQGCLISAAFRSLGVQSEAFYVLMDDRLKLESQMMTIQELLDSLEVGHGCHITFY